MEVPDVHFNSISKNNRNPAPQKIPYVSGNGTFLLQYQKKFFSKRKSLKRPLYFTKWKI